MIERTATCAELAGVLPEVDARSMFVSHPVDRAVVLGSSQSFSAEQHERCRGLGYSVVRRRSGGGGVVIVPEEMVWVDLFLPATDAMFVRDVRDGSYWVGDLWTVALEEIVFDPGDLDVHRGAMVETRWSSMSCFAGVGPGEVTHRGRKVMGLSQRRTRLGAWFFSLAYCRLDPERDAHLLAEDDDSPEGLATLLSVGVVDLGTANIAVVAGLLRSLEQLPGPSPA